MNVDMDVEFEKWEIELVIKALNTLLDKKPTLRLLQLKDRLEWRYELKYHPERFRVIKTETGIVKWDRK